MPPSTSNNDTPLTINSIITPPNTKIPIPRLGFGLWQLPGEAALAPTRAALKAGYRHLDSAQLYRNEAQVGEVLRTMAPLRREDVFVTTKQGVRGKTKEETYEMARESVRKISGHEDGDEGYVDLFLVHTPRGGYETRKEIWVDALERLHAEGRARLIGVSNYGVEELEEMKAYATVWPPHVNQIEVCLLSPFSFLSLSPLISLFSLLSLSFFLFSFFSQYSPFISFLLFLIVFPPFISPFLLPKPHQTYLPCLPRKTKPLSCGNNLLPSPATSIPPNLSTHTPVPKPHNYLPIYPSGSLNTTSSLFSSPISPLFSPLPKHQKTNNLFPKLNPWSSQNPKTQNTITYCQTHGIVLQAYSPLATGSTTKLSDPSLASIAKKHSKSPAQVLIRYGLQKGWVVLPKSQTGERIVENADVFDGGFELDGGDMEILDGLDCLDEEGEEEEE